jgi:SAM-dependent methyltransferase
LQVGHGAKLPAVLRRLPTVVPAEPDRPVLADEAHPMRKVTRQIAFEPGGWTDERREKVAALFDGLAPSWNERDDVGRHDALLDALDRGGPFADGPCLELGSGTGIFTADLAARFSTVIAVDVSGEMLARADPACAPRVQADSARLPFPDAAAGTVVLVNMFLFPSEVDRVLAPGGALVWVSALGDATPIYLSPDDAAAALPGPWEGVYSQAGWGTWTVVRRQTAD